MYFGISPSDAGVDKKDMGYKNLQSYLNVTNAKKNLIAIRMLDQNFNNVLLADQILQKKVIEDIILTTKKDNFNGIVLDFEFSALNFNSINKKITSFVKDFSTRTHENNLQFFVTAYGDTFYRDRPFDIKEIATQVDGIYVLAYDFHKAKGDP